VIQAILTRGRDGAALFTFVVIVTGLSFFVTQLDVTIVNVALPRIAYDLTASVGALQWVVDAYTGALAVTIPASKVMLPL
jgi:DHA2 family methylenomycin A resistance protein-like MFS transporter